MKVGIFTSEYLPFPGGIATYCHELGRAAVRLGFEPTIYTFGQGSLPVPQSSSFRVERLKPDLYSHGKLPEMACRIARLTRREKMDLCYAADMQTIIAFGAVSVRGVKRAGVHGTDVKSRPIRWLTNYTPYKPLTHYDQVVANSSFTRDLTLRIHPYLQPDRVICAPLGVDSFWREPVTAADVESVSQRLNIPAGNTLLVSVGRLEERKGVLNAVRGLAKLKCDLSKLTYLIIGRRDDEAYAKRVAEAASECGADVRLMGVLPRDDIRALFHRATCLVHTATSRKDKAEGFGLVIIEAAATGLPSIVTDVDALPEVVKDGVSGYVVADRNEDELARMLERVVIDPQQFASMREGCMVWSREFNWDACAKKAFGAV